MRMAAVKAVLRTGDQKGSRKVEDDGKARQDIASGAIFVIGSSDFFVFHITVV